MATLNNIIKNPRNKKRKKSSSPALQSNPQKKAVCLKVFKASPRKPNSAKRSVARVNMLSFDKKITAFIPGIGHNLKEFSLILISGAGGSGKDLPGVRYKAIRGVYDLEPVKNRLTKRSKYGVKRSKRYRHRYFMLRARGEQQM